jgi:L-lactate dehydrogenase complex protein LldG
MSSRDVSSPDMSSRDEVLRRVRAAVGATPSPDAAPLAHRRRGDHAAGDPALVDLLVERLVDYRAHVVRCTAADDTIGAAVAQALDTRAAQRAVVPPGLPTAWRPVSAVEDDGMAASALDALDAVVTGCAVAVAETGTLVLDGSSACGRRAITLVPDLHVCVVRVEQVVQTVPEGLERLDPLRPLTFISGPSATSDIELDRVEGVHGPRTLVVIVAGGA